MIFLSQWCLSFRKILALRKIVNAKKLLQVFAIFFNAFSIIRRQFRTSLIAHPCGTKGAPLPNATIQENHGNK